MVLSKRTSFIIGLIAITTIVACNHFPYAKTNRVYKKHTKDLVTLLKENPSIQTISQLPKAEAWVGTTNFDLRKPNFVVIHHTAQNSCEQTLKTFTLERSKVIIKYQMPILLAMLILPLKEKWILIFNFLGFY